jgi:hypothetical protein
MEMVTAGGTDFWGAPVAAGFFASMMTRARTDDAGERQQVVHLVGVVRRNSPGLAA